MDGVGVVEREDESLGRARLSRIQQMEKNRPRIPTGGTIFKWVADPL